jgi:hypothetical protein
MDFCGCGTTAANLPRTVSTRNGGAGNGPGRGRGRMGRRSSRANEFAATTTRSPPARTAGPCTGTEFRLSDRSPRCSPRRWTLRCSSGEFIRSGAMPTSGVMPTRRGAEPPARCRPGAGPNLRRDADLARCRPGAMPTWRDANLRRDADLRHDPDRWTIPTPGAMPTGGEIGRATDVPLLKPIRPLPRLTPGCIVWDAVQPWARHAGTHPPRSIIIDHRST